MSLPKTTKSKKKRKSVKRKKVADLRMSEKSTRGDGTYTPTIRVGTETPLTMDMNGSFVWGKFKPKGANSRKK